MKILIVDDEPGILQVSEDNLKVEGYQTQTAKNGQEAFDQLSRERYDKILDKISGIDAFPTNQTVDNYIVKLRRKLEKNPNRPEIIQSVYGKGYRMILYGNRIEK